MMKTRPGRRVQSKTTLASAGRSMTMIASAVREFMSHADNESDICAVERGGGDDANEIHDNQTDGNHAGHLE